MSSAVQDFEKAFAEWSGAKYCVALCNGTATLHTAIESLGWKRHMVAVPPLSMSSTTIAVLHAEAYPFFCDVDESCWLMDAVDKKQMGVSLYGLNYDGRSSGYWSVDDAAQTLRKHGNSAFTSWSFQRSKVLNCGEGGMLGTNEEELAVRAREFSSLGYRMTADQPRIDKYVIKSPRYDRHYSLGFNYRMNDLTAEWGLKQLRMADQLLAGRREAFAMYADVVADCPFVRPQFIPQGWQHDAWAFAVACDTPQRALEIQAAVVFKGGEMPYGAWKLAFDEPAFAHLDPGPNACPVARSLQPRLLQFQTNDIASAERNATALRKAIQEIGA